MVTALDECLIIDTMDKVQLEPCLLIKCDFTTIGNTRRRSQYHLTFIAMEWNPKSWPD